MRPITVVLAIACAAVGADALLRAPAAAAPVVKVRARTEIVMEPVRRTWDGVEVRGQVIDRFTGEPVPSADVEVRMNALSRSARTDADGVFSATFRVPDGRYDLFLEYQGDIYRARSSLEMGGVDVRKESLELSVRAADVGYGKDAVEVEVRASAGRFGARITADLHVGPASGALRYVGKVTTNSEGRGLFTLDRELLGKPGRKRIRARFLGDRAFNPAEAQSDFLLTTDTYTELSVDTRDIAYESTLSGTGRVTDSRGQGIAGAPVALMVGTRRLGQALTDDSGAFRLRVPGSEIGAGTYHVQAVFDPGQPWHRSSRSELAQIRVAEPEPVPVTYTLAAFGATALAMMAFLGLRTRPWQSWLERLGRRDRHSEASPPDDDPAAAEIAHGLQPARPSLVSNLRRPGERDFTGTVRDAVRGRPVAQCLVSLVHPEAGERQDTTDRSGEFELADLEPGAWQVRASAHGYVTEAFAVTMPHRGELRGARIDLLPVRERVFTMYREVARPLLPRRELWGIWTPRQIFDFVRAERPASALSELTDFVEETYFSHRVYPESILDQAESLIGRARGEVEASGQGPRGPRK